MGAKAQLAIHGGDPVRTRQFSGWPELRGEDRRALLQVFHGRRWSASTQPDSECVALERELADFHGVRAAVAVSSGTAALMVALKGVGVASGDEVVVPALSYVASATAVSLVGGVPVFVDVDRQTHNIIPAAIEEALSARTRAIVVVHLHGLPCDMNHILAIARARAIPVIEDCAQAHGASYRGRRVGTFGVAAAFSFAANKNLTSGEGGAVLTDDPSLARDFFALRNHGRPPREKDDHPGLGWGVRLTEFQSALLRLQLRRLDVQLARKAEGAAYLADQLDRLQVPWFGRGALAPRGTIHGLFCFPFSYDESLTNVPTSEFIRALTAEGIPTGNRRTLAIPDLSLFRRPESGVPSRALSFEGAREVSRKLIRMGQPTGSGLLLDAPQDLADIARAVGKVAEWVESSRPGTVG